MISHFFDGAMLRPVAAALLRPFRSCALPTSVQLLSRGRDAPLGAPAPAAPPPRRQLRAAPVAMGRRSAKIAGRKGKSDAAKAKLYGKLGKMIAQEVRAGGPDPVANARLRDIIAQAKAAQLPVEIVERNIKKAQDKGGADYAECLYEAYGPGGTGFVIEALTDNVNRTAAEVRSAVTKGGGKMADSGSVLFSFARVGVVAVAPGAGEDAVLEAAMDAGASDVLPSTDDDGVVDGFRVMTALEDYAGVAAALCEAAGIDVDAEGSGLVYEPTAPKELDDAGFEANEAMLERLLAVDDVDAVFTNFS